MQASSGWPKSCSERSHDGRASVGRHAPIQYVHQQVRWSPPRDVDSRSRTYRAAGRLLRRRRRGIGRHPRWRGQPRAAGLHVRLVLRNTGQPSADDRSAGLLGGAGLRAGHLSSAAGSARARIDARDQRADLSDLQDLPDPAGQVPADSVAVHRHGHPAVLQGPRRLLLGTRGDHSRVQPDRHGRQLRGRLVRHPRQYLRELTDQLRGTARQALPGTCHPDAVGHERGHGADQRGTADDAHHHALPAADHRRVVFHRVRDR